MTDGIFSQVQVLQETQSYESCFLQSSQVIGRQISVQNSQSQKKKNNVCNSSIFALERTRLHYNEAFCQTNYLDKRS